MSNIIIVTGPTGVGKSTISKVLVQKCKKGVRLDIDRVKHFIKSGFVYDDSPIGKAQWDLCAQNVLDIAKRFAAENYDVVIEGVLGINGIGWDCILDWFHEARRFVLTADVDMIKQRNRDRSKQMQMEDSDIERHLNYFNNPYFANWNVLDTTETTPNEIAESIRYE